MEREEGVKARRPNAAFGRKDLGRLSREREAVKPSKEASKAYIPRRKAVVVVDAHHIMIINKVGLDEGCRPTTVVRRRS